MSAVAEPPTPIPERDAPPLGSWLWLGLALSALFFAPLTAALAESLFYMHWQREDSLELALAYLASGALFGLGLRFAAGIGSPRLCWLALTAICVVPVASFLGFMSRASMRQAGAELAAMGPQLGTAAMIAGALAALLAAAFFPKLARKLLLISLAILSPLTLLSGYIVIQTSFDEFPLELATPSDGPPPTAPRPPDIQVIVFDAMGYETLYSRSEVRSELEALRAFSERSDNYHRARSPGPNTMESMPGLITGREGIAIHPTSARGSLVVATPDGFLLAELDADVFSIARSRGYRTALVGWHLPYCAMWEASLDACHSFSEFNRSSVQPGFSLLNPFATTLALWPEILPLGFLKGLASAPIMRDMTEAIVEHASANLEDPRPLFQVLHFGVPHPPYIFDAQGYTQRLDPYGETRERYREQLGYVDQLFERLLDAMKSEGRFDTASVLLLSDHAHIRLAKQQDLRAIPLIHKRPGQQLPRQRFERVGSEELLWEVVNGTN